MSHDCFFILSERKWGIRWIQLTDTVQSSDPAISSPSSPYVIHLTEAVWGLTLNISQPVQNRYFFVYQY